MRAESRPGRVVLLESRQAGGHWFEPSTARTFFAQEIETDTGAAVAPRIASDKVGSGPLFVGEDSAWFGGYGRQEETIAFKLDPQAQTIERFLRIGDFLFTGMAFDAENQAIWIARAAPASVVRVALDEMSG